MFLLFAIIYPKINMIVVKTISAWQNPWQFVSVKSNFKCWLVIISIFPFLPLTKKKYPVENLRKNEDGSYSMHWFYGVLLSSYINHATISYCLLTLNWTDIFDVVPLLISICQILLWNFHFATSVLVVMISPINLYFSHRFYFFFYFIYSFIYFFAICLTKKHISPTTQLPTFYTWHYIFHFEKLYITNKIWAYNANEHVLQIFEVVFLKQSKSLSVF